MNKSEQDLTEHIIIQVSDFNVFNLIMSKLSGEDGTSYGEILLAHKSC